MKKRMLALMLIGVMTVNMNIGALAADEAQNAEAVEVVADTEEASATEETADVEAPAEAVTEEAAAEAVTEEAAAEETTEEAVAEEATEETPTEEESEKPAGAETLGEANVQNGWSSLENGNRCYYLDGKMLVDDIYSIDGIEYGFDADGSLLVNRIYGFDGEAYGFNYDGVLYKNEVFNINDNYYCAGIEGELLDGWITTDQDESLYADTESYILYKDKILEENGNQYYFDENCKLVQNQSFYYYDEKGDAIALVAGESGAVIRLKNQWCKVAGNWYYYGADQTLVRDGVYTINGKKYCFYWDGQMATSSYQDGEKCYLLDENGAVVNEITSAGWVKKDGNWYYFVKDEYGNLEMVRYATRLINGKTYLFNYDGSLAKDTTCWTSDGWYAADSQGVVRTSGWFKLNDNWCYAKKDGKLYTDTIQAIGGKKYIFDQVGNMMTGMTYFNNDCYITDANGAVIEKEGWVKNNLSWYYVTKNSGGKLKRNTWGDNKKYYFLDDGSMAVGTVLIDGASYYFDANGVCKDNSTTNFKGWKLMDGYWYYHDKDGKPYDGLLNGQYYIDHGRMLTDVIIETDQGLMYFDVEGKKGKTGWHKLGGYILSNNYWSGLNWTYVNAEGIIPVDWIKVDGAWYYINEYGHMVTGRYIIGGKTWLFDENGRWINTDEKKGWQKIDGEWYYFESAGKCLTDTNKTINGKKYSFDYTGKMIHNKVVMDSNGDKLYWVDSNGAWTEFKGWKYSDGSWYYNNSDGTPKDGILKENGAYYYISNGRMNSGYLYVSDWDGYYFFNSAGRYQKVTNGWVANARGYWYYFENGQPVKDTIKVINGATYWFMSSGTMVTGRYGGYVFGSDGKMLHNSWWKQPYSGLWCYADASGRCVYGERKINGKTYWFNSAGTWIK